MWPLLCRFVRVKEGASFIEFAISAPFLLILGMGILEFGSALYGHHVITTGVHDAARYLARLPDPTTQYSSARTLAVTGSVTGTSQRLSWWGTSGVTPALFTIANPIDAGTGERTYRGPDPITVVRVTATASYPGFGLLNFLGLPSSLAFSVTHEERVMHE